MKHKFLMVLAVLSLLLVSGFAFASLAEADQRAVDNYNNAKNRYQIIKNGYLDAKEDWLGAKNKYAQARNSANLALAFDKAQEYMLKATDHFIAHLDIYTAKVDALPNLPDGTAEEIKADIAAERAKLVDLRADIEAAADVNQLKDLTDDVRNEWNSVKSTVKRIVGEILAAHINAVIDKANEVSARVDAKISELSAEGYDTAELEAWLADYDSKVGLAEQKYEAARERFAAINDTGDADRLFREGHQFIKEANKYLIEAHKTLKDIVKEMRSLRKGTGNAEVSGTGWINADGNGSFIADGTIQKFTLEAESASLEVQNKGTGAVTVKVNGNAESVAGGETKSFSAVTSAEVESASAQVLSLKITVNDTVGLEAYAKGTGTATLSGTGKYSTGKQSNVSYSGTATVSIGGA